MMRQSNLRMMAVMLGMVCGLCFAAPAVANEYQQAVEATQTEDYAKAIELWLKLAEQGDPIAQYNLAVFYREGYGTTSDPDQSQKWFKAAAQHRLVQAANQFDQNVIKPIDDEQGHAAGVDEATSGGLNANDPIGWVLLQNPKYYTLQLASSRSEESIKQYYQENNMQGKGGYYKSERDGEIWYYLIYGAFHSSGEANTEIEKLPEEIRKWSPWVRRLGNIQKVVNR